jgi:hypothetical protein
VEIETPESASEPSFESPRMEVETQVETQVEGGGVEKVSTWNDSTESTTYGDTGFSPPEFPPGADADEGALYARDVYRVVDEKMAGGKTRMEALVEAQNEIGEFEDWQKRRAAIFDSICDRLRGGARDATAAT